MPFVSVTRLRLRSVRFLPGFAWNTWRSMRQVRRAPGFLGGRLAGDKGLTAWTLTVWESEPAMRAYRNTGTHMDAMPKLLNWCDEASVAHWEQQTSEVPDYAAARKLGEIGRVSKVSHPSPKQAEKIAWPDGRVPTERLFLTSAMERSPY